MKPELDRFLVGYLASLHITTDQINSGELLFANFDQGLRTSILGMQEQERLQIDLDELTLLHVEDLFGCSYSLFAEDETKVRLVGPYLKQEVEVEQIKLMIERLELPVAAYQQLKEYYYDLPLLKDPLWFLNLMQQWAKHDLGENIKIQHVKHAEMEALNLHYLVPEDPIVSMRIVEERYAAEQDLFLAVQYGNYQKMYELLESGMMHRFAKRVDDPLLEARHRLIVFNTLMRRAVYQGGVHPLHIDRLSNHLAICINTLEDPQQADGLMKQIVTSYFSLVKEHSLAQYSKPVQTMLATIDASLVADLRLQRFAESLFMNASYLSTLFKKEVGKTLTDYVNDKRLQFSKTLLTTTTLSMQEIAIGCGVKDLHYYTRLFKQYEGCTPSQYRKLHTKTKKNKD